MPRSFFRAGGDTGESRLQNIVQFVTKRGGGLIVLGGQDVYRAGGYGDSALAEILPFDLSNRIDNKDQFEGMFFVTIPKPAYDHPILQLLPNAAENRERLNSLRQLDGSNNVGGFKPLATPLLTRTVKVKGKDDTLVEKETPIMGLHGGGRRQGAGRGSGHLWRWQLQPDFDDPPLAMLLANAVRYPGPAAGPQAGPAQRDPEQLAAPGGPGPGAGHRPARRQLRSDPERRPGGDRDTGRTAARTACIRATCRRSRGITPIASSSTSRGRTR